MTNSAAARKTVADTLGEAAVADHFCVVSMQLDKIAAFGIRSDRVFGFWDWVGGRYSIWSSIGLLLAIGIGKERFEEFLLGGQDIDIHFTAAPPDRNIPVLMALLTATSGGLAPSMTENSAICDTRHGAGSSYPHRQPAPSVQVCLKHGNGVNWRATRRLSGECRLR
jgi:glucose-6-phosphate isomerase